MKTYMIRSLLITGIFSIHFITAMAKGDQPVQDTRQIITNQITYPEFAIEKHIEGTVEVTFTINSEGRIVISNIESTNEELSEYVKSEIEKIQLTDNLNDMDLQYSIKLKFRLDS